MPGSHLELQKVRQKVWQEKAQEVVASERLKINPRRIAYFVDNHPVSTLVEVKGLVDPRMKVGIECQAFVG